MRSAGRSASARSRPSPASSSWLLPLGVALEESVGLSLLFRLRGSRPPPPDVLIVAIDRPAAEALGLPANPNRWPRTQHADLVDALHRGGAAAIVFDVVFDEPGAPIDDRTFAEADPAGRHRRARPATHAGERARAGADPRASADPFHVERLTSPLPLLAEAAAGLAPFPLPKVPVQVSRYWTFKAGAGNAPSLPVVAFHVYARDAHEPLVSLLKTAGAQPPEEALSRDPALPRPARSTSCAPCGKPSSRIRKPGCGSPTRSHGPEPDGGRARATPPRATGSSVHGAGLPLPRLLRPASHDPHDPVRPGARPAGRARRKPGRARQGRASSGSRRTAGAEQRDGVNTVFSEPNGLDLSGVEVAATAFANHRGGAVGRARCPSRAELAPRDRLGARARLPRVAPAAARLGDCSCRCAGMLYLLVARNRFTAAGLWLPLVGPLAVQIGVGRGGVRALEASRHAARARAPVDRARPLPPAEDRRGAGPRDRRRPRRGPARLRHVPVHGRSPVHDALGDHGARGARRSHEPLLRASCSSP